MIFFYRTCSQVHAEHSNPIFMNLSKLFRCLLFTAPAIALAQTPALDPEGEKLIQAALDRLSASKSLVVDAQFPRHSKDAVNNIPDATFRRNHELRLLRPHFIRAEYIFGAAVETRSVYRLVDGSNVWEINANDFVTYKQPLRPENFYQQVSPVVQYFFKPAVDFDPTDPIWGQAVSVFTVGKSSYDRLFSSRYAGEIEHLGDRVKLVERRLTTDTQDVRQLFYLKGDEIRQIDTRVNGNLYCVKYRNYRFDEQLPESSFVRATSSKLPIQDIDPVRLGEKAPDFELPLNNGGNVKMSELLKDRKGLLVVALNGAAGAACTGPDVYLPQMRIMQQVRDKFGAQGLEVMAVVGGTFITPDVKDEMLRNWMPDQTRFSYPIAVDIDLEKGIQGSAYHNFNLNGRNNVLLDAEGRVVFACEDFDSNRTNELALYQALAQIGFSVTPADLEINRR